MYRTYIWLTAMCPPGPRSPSSTLVCSAFSPPTKKLPCAFSTRGVSGVCRSVMACAATLGAIPMTPASVTTASTAGRHNVENLWLSMHILLCTRAL